MSCIADARGAMDVHPYIAGRSDERFARVHAHPYVQGFAMQPGMSSQRSLRLRGALDRILCSREGNKECIALCVHLMSVPFLDRGAHDFVVICQHGCVFLAEFVEQVGRLLDVGKKEGYRSGWLRRRRAPWNLSPS